ncbi:monovalent cation/H(+) antiporter subunit G [Paenibacillus abyssi]|uniref:Na+/H+ antiporter subunit G n=1 Tax=Paenibacillus abyssi TaxID=1340531 RepID=A0A917G2M3_9BACL|nr:monovalent cation/H(+) antiporter subunit G [Paenibacillus abyssi]GGG20045.1 Na+/H+ antiporter subunit G [Paenibacillus abyssi]
MGQILITIGEWSIAFLVLFGAVLSVLSTFGLIRLPDVYLRSHAATKTATLGILCVLFAAFLYFILYEGHVSAKLLLGIVFVFITAPVASHLIDRSAYFSGVPMWEKSVQDDLKIAMNQGKHHEELHEPAE